MSEPLRTVHGEITMSRQLYEQTKADHDAFEELWWIATHHDEATPEQRARFEAFTAAVDERDDW